jgi:hypothetical protein
MQSLIRFKHVMLPPVIVQSLSRFKYVMLPPVMGKEITSGHPKWAKEQNKTQSKSHKHLKGGGVKEAMVGYSLT